MKLYNKLLTFFIGILFIFPIILLIIVLVVNIALSVQYKKEYTIPCTAVVVDNIKEESHVGDYYRTIVEFEYNGNVYQSKSNSLVEDMPKYSIGDNVDIYVNPQNTDVVLMKDLLNHNYQMFKFIALFVIVLIIFTVITVKGSRYGTVKFEADSN